MRFVFDNMNDYINNIPKETNIAISYYGNDGRILLYGTFIEGNEDIITIKTDKSEVKIIEILSINEITILDKLKLAIDKDDNKYFKLEYKVFQDNEWKMRTEWFKDENEFRKDLEIMSNNPYFEILNHD